MKTGNAKVFARVMGPARSRAGAVVRRRTLTICCALFIFSFCGTVASQQRNTAARGRGAPVLNGQRSVQQQEFEKLVAQANSAREAGRFDEAIELYRRAVAAHPKWDEGWWYLATLLYDRDNYAEAARAFRQTAELQSKIGTPLVMLGLCEFQLGHYDDALAHITRGHQLGLVDNPELGRVMRYHEGLLLLLKGEFEAAQQMLDGLAFEGLSSENLIIALGSAVLRVPVLPDQIDPHQREHDLIRRAGWAELQAAQRNTSDALREYSRLAEDFAKVPNVQYAFGRFLLARRDQEGALAAFHHEIENAPDNALPRLQLAFMKLNNKESAEGLPLAREALRLAPNMPVTHYLLGRLLFDAGQNAEAIVELETAKRFWPDEPKVYFALARAYARANRKEDAARARETFTRLNQLAEQSAGQGVKRGEVIQENNTGQNEKPGRP